MANHNNESQKMLIHEEKLDISSEKVKTAEVTVHKETIHEIQTIEVPVTREEIVIERKKLAGNISQSGDIETIRIPVQEEHVEVRKYPVQLEEVTIHQEEIHDIKEIKETIRKEEINIEQ